MAVEGLLLAFLLSCVNGSDESVDGWNVVSVEVISEVFNKLFKILPLFLCIGCILLLLGGEEVDDETAVECALYLSYLLLEEGVLRVGGVEGFEGMKGFV